MTLSHGQQDRIKTYDQCQDALISQEAGMWTVLVQANLGFLVRSVCRMGLEAHVRYPLSGGQVISYLFKLVQTSHAFKWDTSCLGFLE